MFAKYIKKSAIFGVLALGISTMFASGATAADAPSWKSDGGNIPVNVTLTGITSVSGPMYISIQKRAEYMGMKGHGGILKEVTLGEMSAAFKVDAPDDYAVSVWHDLNDDGIFSMDENYKVLDGWGNSAAQDVAGRPSFDDVKVSVPAYGADVTVKMKYPG